VTLQEKINNDLKNAIKNRDKNNTNSLKLIVGELQRSQEKELDDKKTLCVIKKLIKYEKENINRMMSIEEMTSCKSEYLELLETYLPQQTSDDDVKNWIRENIDFSKFSNKSRIMKQIMNNFGSSVSGGNVKKILDELVILCELNVHDEVDKENNKYEV